MTETPTQEALSNENLKIIADKYNQVLQKIYDGFFPHFIDTLLNSFSDVIQKITEGLLANPVELIKYQLEYYSAQSGLVQNLSDYTPPSDKRFQNKQWQTNALYFYLRGSYHLTSDFMEKMVNNLPFDNAKQKRKALFFVRQLSNAFSPTNFCWTNPEIIETFYATGGHSLIKGLDNLLADLEHSDKVLNISTTNNSFFKLGENICFSKGEVVFQNELLQLIHYYPLQQTNYEVPILIIPPCINKFYILDLSEKNSFVKWLLEQGFSVFMISWKNPDKTYENTEFNDYILRGTIAANEFLQKTYGYDKISAIGYCIGGTMLSLTNAYLESQNCNNFVSNLFLTTLLDFTDGGEISLFIDPKSVESIKKQVLAQGFIDGAELAGTFSMLRANDMIWHFYVNNYLLGKDPFPFDILYWNSDSTRLPAKMYLEYLNQFYLDNILVNSKKFSLGGTIIDIHNIKSPMYFLAAKDDHIVPWQSCYEGLELLQKQLIKFVLTDSGHVSGVVNPPAAGKYCYYTNNASLDKTSMTTDKWLASAEKTAGSWWGDWLSWQKQFAGKQIIPKMPINPIEAAPGSYVRE